MMKECIDALSIKEDGIYVDVTFGGGGHSKEILKHLKKGKLIAFDRDEEVEKNKNKFSSEDQEKLDIVTKRIINKILHHPTIELRKADEGSNSVDSSTKIGVIRELFGINPRKKSDKD